MQNSEYVANQSVPEFHKNRESLFVSKIQS